MKRVLQNERGMALALAIFALVVVGALVAAAFFAGTQEQRVGENWRRLQQSFGAAETGLNEVIRCWDPQRINSMRQYPLDSIRVPLSGLTPECSDTLTPDHSGVYGGYVYRLNDQVYMVDVTARDRRSNAGIIGGGARQRLGQLVRIRLVNFGIGAALTTRGAVDLKGNALVSGRDTVPQGWNTNNCDTIGDTTKAGIRTPDPSQVTTQRPTQLAGTPRVNGDTSIHSNTFNQFGDISYASLAASANIQLSGGNYKTFPTLNGAGACDKTNSLNWGDGMNPAQPCGHYFPIIHVAGNITLNGDQGQGILLVDGDLQIQGSYIFYGIVLVQGSLQTAGGGSTDAHFYGAVMASNVSLELNSLAGNATLQYSKCAITNAMEGTQSVSPIRSRGWIQLF